MNNPITEAQARQLGELRNILYRSWPNSRDYSFTFATLGGGWRIYINNSPGYGGRPCGSVASHRLDISTRPYICWSPGGQGHSTAIATLSEAQAVAALWADCTENYIATGSFEPAAGRPQVQDRSVLNGFGGLSASPSQSLVPGPTTFHARDVRRGSRWTEIRNRLFS